jgi:hypothetical protein
MSQTTIYHFNNDHEHQTKLQTKFKDAINIKSWHN